MLIKCILQTILFCSLSVFCLAQQNSKFFLETNIARYAMQTGLFEPGNYPVNWQFLNSIRLGYTIKSKAHLNAGIRILPGKVSSLGGYDLEEADNKGLELNLGYEQKLISIKKLSLLGELGLFYERSIMTGIYWVDYPPTYEINHKRYFVGQSSELKLSYKITSSLTALVSSRLRYGVFNQGK